MGSIRYDNKCARCKTLICEKRFPPLHPCPTDSRTLVPSVWDSVYSRAGPSHACQRGERDFELRKQLWAARVSNPARRIKSCTYAVLPRPASVVLCRSVRLAGGSSCCPVLSRPSSVAASVTESVTESLSSPPRAVREWPAAQTGRDHAGAGSGRHARDLPGGCCQHRPPAFHRSSGQPDPAARRARSAGIFALPATDHDLTNT